MYAKLRAEGYRTLSKTSGGNDIDICDSLNFFVGREGAGMKVMMVFDCARDAIELIEEFGAAKAGQPLSVQFKFDEFAGTHRLVTSRIPPRYVSNCCLACFTWLFAACMDPTKTDFFSPHVLRELLVRNIKFVICAILPGDGYLVKAGSAHFTLTSGVDAPLPQPFSIGA